MRYVRGDNNQNRLIGVFLLILLAVIAGPTTLPRILPFTELGVPCASLPQGTERGLHQSYIGRLAENPLQVIVRPSPVPSGGDNQLYVSIVMVNNSIGTVPILYNSNQILVGDNGTNGMGVVFNPPNNLSNGAVRQNPPNGSYPETDIRLLGPRQRCVHEIAFTVDPGANPSIFTGTATVQAFYRMDTPGQVTTGGQIFPNQGLRVQNNFIQSDPVVIPLPAQPQ